MLTVSHYTYFGDLSCFRWAEWNGMYRDDMRMFIKVYFYMIIRICWKVILPCLQGILSKLNGHLYLEFLSIF